VQGIVAYFDGKDLVGTATALNQNVRWRPRAGTMKSLEGTATLGGGVGLQRPRLQSNTSTTIAGNSPSSFVAALSSNCCNCSASVMFIGNTANCNARMFGQFVSSTGEDYFSVQTLNSNCDASVSQGINTCKNGVMRTSDPFFVAATNGDSSFTLGGTPATIYGNGVSQSIYSSTSWTTSVSPLFVGQTSNRDQTFDGSVMFMILADRAFSAKEVHDLSIWSLNEFGIGIQLMSFELDIWNTVAPGTVYWTPPSSMLPMTEFTVSFALQINSDSFNERNIFQIDSPLSHFAVNIKAGVNQLSLSISDKSNVMTKDCSQVLTAATHITITVSRINWAVYFGGSTTTITGSFADGVLGLFTLSSASRFQQASSRTSSGFLVRNMQMFGYTMSSNEALLPRILSVCPSSVPFSPSIITFGIYGSYFDLALPCTVFVGSNTAISSVCVVVSSIEVFARVALGWGSGFESVSVMQGESLTTCNTCVSRSMQLTSALTGFSPVNLTFAFLSPSRVPIKTISVSGLPFSNLITNSRQASCSNIIASTPGSYQFNPTFSVTYLPWVSSLALILPDNQMFAPLSSDVPIICTVSSFINRQTSYPSIGNVSVSTYDANFSIIDFKRGFSLPPIVRTVVNATLSLSSVLTATSTDIYISISLVESPVSNTAVCLEAAYMAPASLKCDFGVISNLTYARWGLFETGSSCAAGHTYKTSSCSASNVSAVIAELCIGKVSCSFTPSDGLFSFVEIFKNVGNTSWIAPAGVTSVDVLVVAGGGSGGGSVGGGGGGGGVTYVSGLSINPGQNYTVTVGAGGARASRQTGGNSGGASAFGSITSDGGGGGGCAKESASGFDGKNGGSGGGGSSWGDRAYTAGTGTASQGNGGAPGSVNPGGGGGGGGAGTPGSAHGSGTRNGGVGLIFDITGSAVYYGGGGGGGGEKPGLGGIGGGGSGTYEDFAVPGVPNTGGGGGGGYVFNDDYKRGGGAGGGGGGGSGIVVIRYSICSSNLNSFAAVAVCSSTGVSKARISGLSVSNAGAMFASCNSSKGQIQVQASLSTPALALIFLKPIVSLNFFCMISGVMVVPFNLKTSSTNIALYNSADNQLSSSTVLFPNIFSPLTSSSFSMSSVYQNESSTLTASFIVGTPDSLIKVISLENVAFSSYSHSNGAVYCSNLNQNDSIAVVANVQSRSLTLSLSKIASVFVKGSPVVCAISGLRNSLATSDTYVSAIFTFDESGTPIDGQQNVKFPACFESVARDGYLHLSSYLRNALLVNLTFGIRIDKLSVPIQTISLSGLFFQASFNGTSGTQCSHFSAMGQIVTSSIFTASLGILVISLSPNTSAVPKTLSFFCRIDGFTNGVSRISSSSVQIAMLDSNSVGIATQLGIQFPEIFDPRVVNQISPAIAPTTGSTFLSVFGSAAGRAQWSGSVRVGGSACASNSWVSDSSVACRISRGTTHSSITSSIMLNLGLATNLFTFSIVSAASNKSVLPATAAFVAAVYGSNFGLLGSSIAVVHSVTSADATLWLSSSSLLYKTPRNSLLQQSYFVISLESKASLSYLHSFNADPVLVHVNPSNIPNSGSSSLLLGGHGFGGILNTAASRFGFSAAESTAWRSDSGVQTKANFGTFLPKMALVLSLSQVSYNLSSAASFDAPRVSHATSEVLSDINLSGSNFGPYFAFFSYYATCSFQGTIDPNSDVLICSHTQLSQLRSSGVSVSEMGLTITIQNAARLDDVAVILVSPFNRNFTLVKDKCFGCTNNAEISFSFLVPPAPNHPPVPDFMCPLSGSYTFPSVADVTKVISTSAALGPWFLRVVSGSLPLNLSRASLYFKTSSLRMYVGVSTVSSIIWISDSSVLAGAPGLQSQNDAKSSSGWGKNRSVRGQVITLMSLDSCNYSYPSPIITDVTRGSHVVVSSSLPVSGRFFSNSDPSMFVRMAVSSCSVTRWVSDTCVLCIVPRFAGKITSISASVELSAVAKLENLTLSSAPVDILVGKRSLPTSGGVSVPIVGMFFGLYDSSVALSAISKLSSTVATFWSHDTSISTKVPTKIRAYGVFVTVSNIVNQSISQNPTNIPSHISMISNAGYIASTGSQLLVISDSFGNFGSMSGRLKLGNSVAEFSSWISDSCTQCKSARSYKPISESLVASLQLSEWIIPISGTFQSPSASHCFTTLAENISQINGSGFGVFNSLLLQVNEVSAIVYWTSDSSISCLVPAYRDIFNLQLDFFAFNSGYNHSVSAVARSFVQNPSFIASPKPIAQSLNSLVYIPMPAVVESNIDQYIQRGPLSGWSFPVQHFSTVPSFLFSEEIPIDIVIFNNHTQVYLKNYLPIKIIVFGQISIVDSNMAVLDSLVCFGNTSVTLDLPPISFANAIRTSIAICSAIPILSASIIFSFSVLNEMGDLISFVSHSAAFSVQSRPSSILQYPIGRLNISAGYYNLHVLNVSLSNAGDCSRLVFDYTTNLSCISGSNFVRREFYPYGFCESSNSALLHTEIVRGRCTLSPQWTFGVAGQCVISFEIPRYQVSVAIPVTISSGVPKYFAVIGRVTSSVTGGGIIWSNNASGVKCLVLQFRDRCNNTRSIGGFTCELSASLTNSSQYGLLGPSIVNALSNGECSWCSTRTSLPSTMLVKLEISCSEIIKGFVSLLNVTGLGEPAAVKVLTPPLNNSTIASKPIAPITFKITDATGAPVQVGLTTVVRVRIVRKTNSRYACFSTLALMVTDALMLMCRLRRLLEDVSEQSDQTCPGGGVSFFGPSSPGEITVNGTLVCGAGDNEVVYDIGTLDASGHFIVSELSVFSQVITVLPGAPSCFQIVSDYSRKELTFHAILSSLLLQIMDDGRNVRSLL
jgi:hypothetical protein